MSAAEFDAGATAAAVAAAHEEPTVRFGRYVYRGRLLSIEEWLPFFERRLALEAQAAKDVTEQRPTPLRPWVALWIDYLRAVFPRRDFRFWAPDPVRALRELPGEGLKDAFEYFFFHQARVLGAKIAPPVNPTPGTSSSASTPAPAAAASAT